MQTERKAKEILQNAKTKDSAGKMIFGDNSLCAEFIRDYIDLPGMKNIRAEDIEDVSAQFVPLFEEERNADIVKRVKLRGETPCFFISLIEHKSKVDYNVAMQIFRYMVFIWNDYEKEMEKKEKGISKRASFRYPPILPIVYYEGRKRWTVPKSFRERIDGEEWFGKYIPDFSYYLVPLKEYSNETLLDYGDGISLLMMINKLQSAKDIEEFRRLPPEEMESILHGISDHQRKIIADVFLAALLKMHVPTEEALELAGRVKEKKMGELFEDMEEMDIQAERQKTADALDMLKAAQEKAEQGMRIVIETLQETGASFDFIAGKLSEKFHLSTEEARTKTSQYWK